MIVLVPDSSKAPSDAIEEILRNCKTIAVVGISSKKFRPSHEVSGYLKAAGYRIVGVNPNETEVHGEPCYARLEDIPQKVEIVDIFRKAQDVPPVVESAIRIGAKVVWMQQGIEHAEAAEKARAAGLTVVMDACLLVEHRKRLREMPS